MSTTKVLLTVTIEQLDKDIEMAEADYATALAAYNDLLDGDTIEVAQVAKAGQILDHARDYQRDLEAVRRTLFDARCALSKAW
jgi:hypothetical protein